MRQFSLKNERATSLLEAVTRLTGEGKTEAVIRALELYQASLLGDRETEAVIRSLRKNVHAHLKPEYQGRAPSKEKVEAELGMP